MTVARWRDVIRQTMIGLSSGLLHLLTQKIKRREFLISLFVDIKIDIITGRSCRPEGVNAPRSQQVLFRDFAKNLSRIIEKLACLFSEFRIVENGGITPAHLPRMKEWRPIDVACKIGNRGAGDAKPEKIRLWWLVAAPINRSAICSCLCKREQFLLSRLGGVLFAQGRIFRARLRVEGRFLFFV